MSEHSRGSPSNYNLQGVAFYASGQLENAIQNFNQAIRLNPEFAAAYNNRGSAYHDSGQIERAIEDYTEAIRLRPGFGSAYANRAAAFAQLGSSVQAQQDMEAAMKLGYEPIDLRSGSESIPAAEPD